MKRSFNEDVLEFDIPEEKDWDDQLKKQNSSPFNEKEMEKGFFQSSKDTHHDVIGMVYLVI
jgi:hypothetical protein